MSQHEPKDEPTPTSSIPPPLVSRKEPQPQPAKKQADRAEKTDMSNAPSEPVSRRDPRGEPPSRPAKDPIKASDEDPTGSQRPRQRSRSRSRDRDRRNFNREGRDNRDNRVDRDNRRDRNDKFDRYNNNNRRRDFRDDPMNKQQTYFKTKLCPAYQIVIGRVIQGKCHKEGRCSFAHGQQELREMPNFKKTKLCIEYLHGKCPYNSRQCKYAHGQNELKSQGYSDFGRERERQRERQKQHDYQAQMKKYRINNFQPYGFGMGGGHPSSGYSQPASHPSAPIYSGYNPGPSHVNSWQSQGHHYGSRATGDPWPNYGNSGGWAPRDNIPSTSLAGSFDPVSSTASSAYYRPWDYGAPTNSVGIGRNDGGMAGPNFSGPLPGSFSSGGFGSAPTHFSSSNSGNSNVYPSSGQFGLTNPPPPLPSAPTGPFIPVPYHRSSGETTTNNYEPFSMGMGSQMPRRP